MTEGWHGQFSGSDSSSDILSMTFSKKSASAHTRVLYFDNLRGRFCRWEAKVDGKPAPLAGSVFSYTHNNDNDHYPATIVGECPNVSAGRGL